MAFFIRTIMLATGLTASGAAIDDLGRGPLDDLSYETGDSVESRVSIAGCHFQVDRPHKSHHVPGVVNVVAWIQCNRAVDRIEMTLGLALNGVEQKRETFVRAGTAYLQGNVAVPCVSGTYNGAAVATITFPPGFVPKVGNGQAGSGDVQITC